MRTIADWMTELANDSREFLRIYTYLHQQLAIFFDRLVRVLGLLFLLALDSNVEIHLHFLRPKGCVELVCSTGIRLRPLRFGDQNLGLDEYGNAGIKRTLIELGDFSYLIVRDGIAIVER